MKFFLLLLLFPLTLFSQEEEAQRAARYFEAKQYARALDLYQSLLKKQLTPWQRSAVQYNIGTVLLAEGKWTEAVDSWSAIPLGSNPFPLLTRRMDTNRALARLLQAQHLALNDAEDFDHAYFLLQEALAFQREAEKEECRLQSLQGAQTCIPDGDLNELRIAIKALFAKYAVIWKNFELQNATPQQRLFLLLSAIKSLQERLRFLIRNQHEGALEPFIAFFAKEGNSWMPFWKATESQVEENLQTLFFQGEQSFEQGLALLQSEHFSDSQKHFEKAASSLTELASRVGSAAPLNTAVRHLLGAYQLALLEDPLQELTLSSLLEEQQRDLKSFSSEEASLSTQNLDLSLQSVQQHYPLSSRFYLLEARYLLTKILQPAKRGENETPISLLEHALTEQEHALALNRLYQRMGSEEKGDSKIMQRLKQAQQAVIASMEPFLDVVLKQQIHDFEKPGTLAERCQMHPWDELLPLYEKGYRAASAASSDTPPSLEQQEAVQHNWKAALNLLKKPKKPFKGACQPGGGGGKPESKKGEQKQPTVHFTEVLKNIQEMAEEDKSEQALTITPRKVEKPW